MKRATSLAVAAILLFALTGCGDSLDDIKREAALKEACEKAGGETYYDVNGSYRCDMATRKR